MKTVSLKYLGAALVLLIAAFASYGCALHPWFLWLRGEQALMVWMLFVILAGICAYATVSEGMRGVLDFAVQVFVTAVKRVIATVRAVEYVDKPVRGAEPLKIAWLDRALSVMVCLYGAAMQFHSIPTSVNICDESAYVIGGFDLSHGHWPNFGQFPTTSFFYGLLSLMHKRPSSLPRPGRISIFHNPFMLSVMHQAHIIEFILLWACVAVVAVNVRGGFLLSLGMLLSGVIAPLTYNTSDAFFTILICLAIVASLKRWYIFAIILTSFAGMARPDGLWISILLITYCTLAIGLFTGRKVFAVFAMILVLNSCCQYACDQLVGMSANSRIAFGQHLNVHQHRTLFFSGMRERAYEAFAQGEGAAWADVTHDPDYMDDGEKEAESLYGSAGTNGYNITNAIIHNPGAYFARVAHNLRKLPLQVGIDYGGNAREFLSVQSTSTARFNWLVWLMVIGIVLAGILASQRAMYLVFVLPFFSYILTFYRDGYIFAYAPILFLVAAQGYVCLYDRLVPKPAADLGCVKHP